jgi:hypothetical protein
MLACSTESLFSCTLTNRALAMQASARCMNNMEISSDRFLDGVCALSWWVPGAKGRPAAGIHDAGSVPSTRLRTDGRRNTRSSQLSTIRNQVHQATASQAAAYAGTRDASENLLKCSSAAALTQRFQGRRCWTGRRAWGSGPARRGRQPVNSATPGRARDSYQPAPATSSAVLVRLVTLALRETRRDERSGQNRPSGPAFCDT